MADADETKEAPCRHPGCPKLTDGLYCEEHEALHRGDRARQQAWLQQAVAEGKGKISEGTSFVCSVLKGRSCSDSNPWSSHIRPHRGDPVLFWDEKNWQSLCKPCHDKKTWNEDNNPEYRF